MATVTGLPLELQVMNALGPLAKGLAFLMGKQPEEERSPRGFLGLEWAEEKDETSGQSTVWITRVVKDSPAARTGIHAGDQLVHARGQSVTSLKTARALLAAIRAGDSVELILERPAAPGNGMKSAQPLSPERGFNRWVNVAHGNWSWYQGPCSS